MPFTEPPMSFKRLLALTKVKILTQAGLEQIKLDQQRVTDHLLVNLSSCVVHALCT